ncbi:hypothetical protein J6590_106992, partial [Homalodisca vitripennis]
QAAIVFHQSIRQRPASSKHHTRSLLPCGGLKAQLIVYGKSKAAQHACVKPRVQEPVVYGRGMLWIQNSRAVGRARG